MDSEKLIYQSTLDYYDHNAEAYCISSKDADLSVIYNKFESLIPDHGRILDVGCGSGRDSRYFYDKGYDVVAIDSSKEICAVAKRMSGVNARNINVFDLDYFEEFDGIWACASLLHISMNDMVRVFNRLLVALKNNGIIYASWKYGTTQRYDENGRLYSDFTKESIEAFLSQFTNIFIEDCWISNDVVQRPDQRWNNVLIRKME